MNEIPDKMWQLIQEGLIEYSIDSEGEFVFRLTDKGIEQDNKNKGIK